MIRHLPRHRVARVVTEVLAPAPIAAALLLVVALHSAPTAAQAVRWGVLAVLFAAIIPLLYVLRNVRRRRLSDRHVSLREQRPLPLVVGICSILVGLMLVAIWGAPRELVALLAAMTVGLIVTMLITLLWKISVHTAVASGAVVILVLVFGPLLFVLAPVVGLVGWARMALRDHSLAEVAGGAGVGALVAGVIFSLLR